MISPAQQETGTKHDHVASLTINMSSGRDGGGEGGGEGGEEGVVDVRS